MRLNVLILAVGLTVAIVTAVLMRRPVVMRIEFSGGDTAVVDGTPHPLPYRMALPDDPRLRLRIVNRDSVWRAVGVAAIPARDSGMYTPDQCLPPGPFSGIVPIR